MKDPQLKFFGLIFLTLSVGTAFTLSQYQLLPYFIVLYFFSFYALHSLKYGKDFYISFDHKQELKDEKIVVACQEITSDTHEDDQENRFLAVFDLATNVKRKVLSWGLLLGGAFTLYYVKKFDFSFATVIPLLTCFFIVNSFYSGHLLIALFMNFLTVIFHLNNSHPWVYIPLYSFLLFFTLSHFTKKNIVRKHLNYIILTGLFLTVCSAVNFFLPKNKNEPPREGPMMALTPKQTKEISEVLSKHEAQTKKILKQLNGLPPNFAKSEEAAKLLGKIKLNEQLIENARNLELKKDLTISEKDLLARNLEELGNNLNATQDSYDDLLKKSANGYFKDLDDQSIKQELDKNTGKLSDVEINTLRSMLKKTEKENIPEAVKIQCEKIDELLTRPQTETTREEVKASVAKINSEIARMQEKVVAENKLEKIEVKKVEVLKPEPVKEKKSRFGKLKKLLPPLLFLLVLFVLHYFFSKTGIKKVEPLNREVLEELQSEWEKARKLKFSPREEVIFFYNLFHKSIQKIHYADHETPPSCIVHENMKELNPAIENNTLVVTEVYAQCFYGNHEVTSEALKLFRKSLNKIVRIYQLK